MAEPSKIPAVFSYDLYRDFVRDLIATYPKGGHGQFSKIAKALKTDTVTISQIFSGKRELTIEQALDLCDFLGLSKLEARYFSLLVQRSRTSYYRLRDQLTDELKSVRDQARSLKKVLNTTQEFDDEAKAIFYSDWIYSAVRLACSLPDVHDANSIATLLHLPRGRVQKVLEFLSRYRLVTLKAGRYSVGIASTHLESNSPFIKGRQVSWRLKASEYMDNDRFPENLFYTGPCSISKSDYDEFRKELVELIRSFVKRIGETTPERLVCLNLDLFEINFP
jgi:uncharacterized protein (TIGR02147 family)